MKNQILLLAVMGFIVCDLMHAVEPAAASTTDQAMIQKILDIGFRFGSAIPTDPHVSDRSQAQYDVLKTYLDLGFLDVAERQAASIADWRHCRIYTDIADGYARKQNLEKMKMYLAIAGECRDKLDGWNADWQRLRISAYVANVFVAAGLFDEAEQTLADPESKGTLFQVELERLVRAAVGDGFESSMEKLQTVGTAAEWEIIDGVARAYIQILTNLGRQATPEQCDLIRGRVAKLSDKLPLLMQTPLHCLLAQTVFAAGQPEMGTKILEESANRLNGRPLSPRFDVANLTALARAWDEAAKMPDRAEAALARASDLLKNGNLLPIDVTEPTLALASGYAAHGNQEAAWRYFRDALRAACGLANGRPRAMGAAAVCVAVARAGLPVPADFEETLERELKKPVVAW